MTKILIVDDEAAQREMLAGYLKKNKYETKTAQDGQTALDLYPSFFSPVAVIDLKMPDMNGLELLQKLREINPFVEVIVLTAYGTVETAVEAMRRGAFGYLTKPVNLDELSLNLSRAAEKNRLITENDLLRRTMADQAEIPELIGDSEAMLKVRALVSRVGPSEASVLITGPSGSGKGLVAQLLHQLSERRDKSFVALNCAAFPETLLESELFGHEKGAFTGADRRRAGRFELADGGTIFLDEIGDMPGSMQSKLLRVLEDGRLEPLGSEKSKVVDVRVVSATNQNIARLIEEGRFRQDLYFRINTVNIVMPSLAARGGDIILLARHFLEKAARKMNRKAPALTDNAAAVLLNYAWPGNVRELYNVIERALVLSPGDHISKKDLPGLSRREGDKAEDLAPGLSLADMEKKHINAVLQTENWNMQKCADLLGIHRNTLRQKIKEYHLERPSPKEG